MNPRKTGQTPPGPLGPILRSLGLIVALTLAVEFQVSPLLPLPLAAYFGFRVGREYSREEDTLMLQAWRGQRQRVIEPEGKLAAERGV